MSVETSDLRLPPQHRRIRGDARGGAEAAGRRSPIIVNTCAVTAEAGRQARKAIRRVRARAPGRRDRGHGLRRRGRDRRSTRDARGRPPRRQRRQAAAGAWARPARGRAGRHRRDHGRATRPSRPGSRASRAYPGLRAGPERLRPPLHLLRHPLRPGPVALGAAGGRGRAGRPDRRPRRPRGGAHRRRPHRLWPRPAGSPEPRAPRRGRSWPACRTSRGCASPRSTRSRRTTTSWTRSPRSPG